MIDFFLFRHKIKVELIPLNIFTVKIYIMIEAQNIFKKYGTIEVLKGINITIKEAQIVTIVGRSGAGKTTLLQILGSLMQPDSGSVFIDGVEINRLREKQLAAFRNDNIGFVFQFHQLLPEFTALENVYMPALFGNRNKRKAESKAKDLLDYLKLGHRLHHKPSELSGGEQQRVAVARALINSPKVIFADEPTGNLDTKNKDELHDLLFDLRDKFKQTFVIVTHDMKMADMTDRIIVMEDGKIVDK